MAESSTTLKEKVIQLFGSEEVAVNDIIWELFPNYCKLKLSHLKIISAGLKTNSTGNEIKVCFFIVKLLSLEEIVLITGVLDVISKSSNNNWTSYHYSYQPTATINENHNLFKYTFTSKNHTNEYLAGKDIVKFTLF